MSEWWWWRWRCAPIKYAGTEFANRDTKRPPVAKGPNFQANNDSSHSPAPVTSHNMAILKSRYTKSPLLSEMKRSRPRLLMQNSDDVTQTRVQFAESHITLFLG